MSGRLFTKISPAIWRSERYRQLCDRGKVGIFYLMTNSHVTSAGVYTLPLGYACSDLEWTEAEYRDVCEKLVTANMIDVDKDIVLVERWFLHNPPMNDSHAKGTRRLIEDVESVRLRDKASAAFEQFNTARIEREATAAAEKQEKLNARGQRLSEMLGNTSRLMTPRILARD